MTRKDYVVLAAALREARIAALMSGVNGSCHGAMVAVDKISIALFADNPRFSPSMFLAAVMGD